VLQFGTDSGQLVVCISNGRDPEDYDLLGDGGRTPTLRLLLPTRRMFSWTNHWMGVDIVGNDDDMRKRNQVCGEGFREVRELSSLYKS
jgi:hypothetical protein